MNGKNKNEIFSIGKAFSIITKECSAIYSKGKDVNLIHVSIRKSVQLSLQIIVAKKHPTINVINKNLYYLINCVRDDVPEFNKKFLPYLQKFREIGNSEAHGEVDSGLDLELLRAELYLYLRWFFKSFSELTPPNILFIWNNERGLKKDQELNTSETTTNYDDKVKNILNTIEAYRTEIQKLEDERKEIEMKKIEEDLMEVINRRNARKAKIQVLKSELDELKSQLLFLEKKRHYENQTKNVSIEELEVYKKELLKRPEGTVNNIDIEIEALNAVIADRQKQKNSPQIDRNQS